MRVKREFQSRHSAKLKYKFKRKEKKKKRNTIKN